MANQKDETGPIIGSVDVNDNNNIENEGGFNDGLSPDQSPSFLEEEKDEDFDVIAESENESEGEGFLDDENEEEAAEDESEEDESEEEEEEESEESEEEGESEDELTPSQLLAKDWQEQGFIKDVPDDADPVQLSNLIYENVKESARSQVFQETLKEEGLNQDDIEYLKAKKSGIRDQEFIRLNDLSHLAGYKFDTEAENYEEQVMEYAVTHYAQSLPLEKAKMLAKTEIEDAESYEALIESYRKGFQELVNEKKKSIDDRKLAHQLEMKETQKKEEERVKSYIDKSSYTKSQKEQLNRAFFDRSHVIKRNGKDIRVTLFEKKWAQMTQEDMMSIYSDLILGKGRSQKEAEEAGGKRVIEQLNKTTLKGSRSVKRKKKSPPKQRESDGELVGMTR